MNNYIRYLSHHGIIGQKWGIRRYQNKDGTLTEAGKKRQKRSYGSWFGDVTLYSTDKRFGDILTSKDKEKMQIKASKILTKERKQQEKWASYFSKKSNRSLDKGEMEKYKELLKKAKDHASNSKEISKVLSEISNDKLKAGRDYIVNDYVTMNIPVTVIAAAFGWIGLSFGLGKNLEFKNY